MFGLLNFVTHKHTKLFFCRAGWLMFPRLQLRQGQLTQSIPSVLHHRITAAPLKWQVHPPPPLCCFNRTSRAQQHKRLIYTYTHFLQISKPHTSRLSEHWTSWLPNTHTHTLSLLCSYCLSLTTYPKLSDHLKILSSHHPSASPITSLASYLDTFISGLSLDTSITLVCMCVYVLLYIQYVCGSAFRAMVCEMRPEAPRGPWVKGFPNKMRNLMY